MGLTRRPRSAIVGVTKAGEVPATQNGSKTMKRTEHFEKAVKYGFQPHPDSSVQETLTSPRLVVCIAKISERTGKPQDVIRSEFFAKNEDVLIALYEMMYA